MDTDETFFLPRDMRMFKMAESVALFMCNVYKKV